MPRRAIPVELLKLKGTFRKSRHGHSLGLSDVPVVPEMPATLSKAAYEVWTGIVPLLCARKVLTALDGPALGFLCESVADWEQLRQEVISEGLIYTTTTVSGDEMKRPNPKVAMRDQAEKSMRASLADFGLNPSARSRVHVADAAGKTNKFKDLGK